jgi:GGDEF domain-containing protein
VSTMMTDDHGSANGAHGGVGHLLRMAKTQCGGSLAFAALRKAEGGFAIATYPALTANPTWTVESIDELVRQTWDDPNLTGGAVLVRSGRVLRGMWAGQGHYVKLAVSALADADAPDHPWGLLCVAEPLAGQFEQDQLNQLASLASRLISYLRARQRVFEGSVLIEPEAPSAEPGPAPGGPVESGWVASSERGQLTGEETWTVGPSSEPIDFETLVDYVEEEEHPLDQAADALEASLEPELVQRESRVDAWEFLALDQIDWVEAVAPTAVPPQPGEAIPEGEVTTEAEVGTMSAAVRYQSAADLMTSSTLAQGLDSLLGPDPETGLATLTTLVARLSSLLADVAKNEGVIGLILIEVSPVNDDEPLSPSTLMTVAGRLTNLLRDRDLVARVGPKLFAVLVNLRPGTLEVDAIRRRTLESLTRGTDSAAALRVRSSLVQAERGTVASPEDLLREAANQLSER